PAVNGWVDRRSERLTTPNGSPPRGVVHMIGTDSIAPRRYGASAGQSIWSPSTRSGCWVRKTRALTLHGSWTLIGDVCEASAPSAATTRRVSFVGSWTRID